MMRFKNHVTWDISRHAVGGIPLCYQLALNSECPDYYCQWPGGGAIFFMINSSAEYSVCNREVGPLVGENHGGREHGRGSQHPSHAPWSPGEVAGGFTYSVVPASWTGLNLPGALSNEHPVSSF